MPSNGSVSLGTPPQSRSVSNPDPREMIIPYYREQNPAYRERIKEPHCVAFLLLSFDFFYKCVHCLGVFRGPVAQLVEHSPEERGVVSSILTWATSFAIISKHLCTCQEFLNGHNIL